MPARAVPSARPLLTPRRWAIWVAVLASATAVVAGSLTRLVTSPPSSHALTGVLLLLVLACAWERWPVPVAGGEDVRFSIVFFVCAAVMYGAAVAALIGATAFTIEAVRLRMHPLKAAFNTGVYALMGALAGLAASVDSRTGAGLLVAVVLAAAAVYAVNVGAVTLMEAHARLREWAALVWAETRIIALPFLLSLSIVPLFVITWRSYSFVALIAVVPLVGITLHMRSLEQSRQATVLALTDPLTGLGNRRHLNERLAKELERSDRGGEPLSVCILDVDQLKAINDTRGHEAGDEALVGVAGALRQGGEAFRFGGDEFVLLLPGHTAPAAAAVAAAVR
ncbi:MAG TPA: GGDEF domain-containing protein, partial [Gaiellaceae bacterium]|nr:GGDEF domain-containing protein [Gaiellaceae bacterium]